MDRRLFFLLNMAQRKVFRYADSESEKRLGVSVTHVAALLFIAQKEGCLQKELAQALGLNKPAITGLADRMEKQGLITRKPCETDGRAAQIHLSEKGKAILPAIFPMIETMNHQLTAEFTKEEIEVVLRFLNKVIDNFS